MSDDRLNNLIARHVDGLLSEAEAAELGETLTHDPAAAIVLAEAMRLDAMISQHRRTERAMTAEPVATLADALAPVRRRIGATPYLLAASAMLALVGGVLYLGLRGGSTDATDRGAGKTVATLTFTDTTVSADSGGVLNAGDSITAQWLDCEPGQTELLLTSGVGVDVRGAARIRLDHPMRVTLDRGEAAFTCPPGATGFTVALPGGASAVDLGTAFTASVGDDGDTIIHVTSGRVELRPTADAPVVAEVDRTYRITDHGSRVVAIDTPMRWRRWIADDGFEAAETVGRGEPGAAGRWSGDPASVVSAERGVRPLDGAKMLRFDATSPNGASVHGLCEVWQVVDLRSVAAELRGRSARAELTVHVNRVRGDAKTDTAMRVRLLALRGDPAEFPEQWRNGDTRAIGGADLLTDDDPSTWEPMQVDAELAAGTDYLAILVAAGENVTNDNTAPEFDGHYADGVTLRLTPVGHDAADQRKPVAHSNQETGR